MNDLEVLKTYAEAKLAKYRLEVACEAKPKFKKHLTQALISFAWKLDRTTSLETLARRLS